MMLHTLRIAVGMVATLSADIALAADDLPIKRGIYVRQGIHCDRASNADTLSYWGGKNGINDQQEVCTIMSQRVRGPRRTLSRSCRNIRFNGEAYRNDLTLNVRGRTAFTFGGITYRFCCSLSHSAKL